MGGEERGYGEIEGKWRENRGREKGRNEESVRTKDNSSDVRRSAAHV